MAWSIDSYNDSMAVHYAVQQPESSMVNAPALNPVLLLGGANGKVWKESALTNDNAAPITGTIFTFEFNGGDLRTQPLWGDIYLDAVSPSNLTAQPTVGGNLFGNSTVIAGNNSRQFSQVSCNGQAEQKFMGLAVTWMNRSRKSPRTASARGATHS